MQSVKDAAEVFKNNEENSPENYKLLISHIGGFINNFSVLKEKRNLIDSLRLKFKELGKIYQSIKNKLYDINNTQIKLSIIFVLEDLIKIMEECYSNEEENRICLLEEINNKSKIEHNFEESNNKRKIEHNFEEIIKKPKIEENDESEIEIEEYEKIDIKFESIIYKKKRSDIRIIGYYKDSVSFKNIEMNIIIFECFDRKSFNIDTTKYVPFLEFYNLVGGNYDNVFYEAVRKVFYLAIDTDIHKDYKFENFIKNDLKLKYLRIMHFVPLIYADRILKNLGFCEN